MTLPPAKIVNKARKRLEYQKTKLLNNINYYKRLECSILQLGFSLYIV